MTVQERMKYIKNRERLEEQPKTLMAKGVKAGSPQEAQENDKTKKEVVQSMQEASDSSVPADSSESKETLSVKNLASKFQGSAVQEDDLSKVEGPAGNKPALSPKPKVSADKPSAPVAKAEGPEVVTAKTVPSSKELGEVNGSAAIEAAPVAEVQITEAASESEEPKTLADRRAAFEQSSSTASKEVPVAEKPARSSLNRVGTIRRKFENSKSLSQQNT